MYAGEVIEDGTVEQIYTAPVQEYTRRLLGAIPVPVPRAARPA